MSDHQVASSASPDAPGAGEPRTSLRRRTFLGAALGGAAAVGAGSLAGCSSGSSGGGGGGKSGPATVRLWSWYTEQKDEFPKLIKAFEDKHPNIKVQNRMFGTTDAYLPALQAAVAAGDPPEIFGPHTRALTYGTGGVSADLKKDLGEDFLSDFFDSANQEYTLDGKQYAVGWMAQTFGLFYNPDILSKAKVDGDSIETWDDLIAAAAKVNATGKPCVALSCNPTVSGLDFFLPLLTQESDDPTFFLKLDQLDGVTWEDPVVVKAIELLKKLVGAPIFQKSTTGTSGDQASQMFYTEKSAMLFSGSWMPQGFLQNAPKSFVKKYKIMKTPALAPGKKHWTANQAGAGFAVSDTSKNKDAALTFLKFMYGPDEYSKTMNNSNSMPATKSAAQKIENPQMKLMTSWLLDGEGCPHIPFGNGSTAAGDPLGKVWDGTAGDAAAVAKAMQAAVKNARGD